MTDESFEVPHKKNAAEWIMWLFWWPSVKLMGFLRRG
jgi:hypothetical protein